MIASFVSSVATLAVIANAGCTLRSTWTGAVATLREPMLHYTTWTSDQYVEKLNRYAGWGAA